LVKKWKLQPKDGSSFTYLTKRFRQVPRLSKYSSRLTETVECYDGAFQLCYSPSSRQCIIMTTIGL
jgi:hypothetical protein